MHASELAICLEKLRTKAERISLEITDAYDSFEAEKPSSGVKRVLQLTRFLSKVIKARQDAFELTKMMPSPNGVESALRSELCRVGKALFCFIDCMDSEEKSIEDLIAIEMGRTIASN